MIQLSMDLSKKLKEDGMQRAVDHANTVTTGWSEKAFDFLKGYIAINPLFMTEDVRYASQGIVPSPPSQRAWGYVIRRAVQEGLIFRHDIKPVKNIKAHRANASVWKSLIVKY
jgi:hypothetical protein